MRTSANHHPGLRVADIERSADFYVHALGGRRRTEPMLAEGPLAEATMGRPGVRFRVCHIAFDEGMIELFEFLEPRLPIEVPPPEASAFLHIAFEVDDVAAALQRVERHGGGRFWPDIRHVSQYGFRVIYATDPDGHVIELIDIGIEELARVMWDSSRERAAAQATTPARATSSAASRPKASARLSE